jgi:hypothetical protein
VRRELKAGFLGLAMVALLFAVALAARGGHPGGNGEAVERSIPHAVEDSLVTLVAVTYVLVLLIGVVVAFRYRGEWREPDSHWLRNMIVVCAFLLAITVGYYAIARRPPHPPPERVKIAKELRIPRQDPRAKIPPRHAHFDWPLALSIVGLVLVGGAFVYLRLRRRPELELERTVEEDLAETLDATIDRLRRERDARKAVIAAYANMERVLASHRMMRRPAETPLEYLARILGELEVRESAARRLTQLFEYAKFSRHEIDSAMKEEAISALEDVRDDLRREEAVAA